MVTSIFRITQNNYVHLSLPENNEIFCYGKTVWFQQCNNTVYASVEPQEGYEDCRTIKKSGRGLVLRLPPDMARNAGLIEQKFVAVDEDSDTTRAIRSATELEIKKMSHVLPRKASKKSNLRKMRFFYFTKKQRDLLDLRHAYKDSVWLNIYLQTDKGCWMEVSRASEEDIETLPRYRELTKGEDPCEVFKEGKRYKTTYKDSLMLPKPFINTGRITDKTDFLPNFIKNDEKTIVIEAVPQVCSVCGTTQRTYKQDGKYGMICEHCSENLNEVQPSIAKNGIEESVILLQTEIIQSLTQTIEVMKRNIKVATAIKEVMLHE